MRSDETKYLRIAILLCTARICSTALPVSCTEGEGDFDINAGTGGTREDWLLCDERVYVDEFYITMAASYITRTTGTISAVSSALIIFVILRSSIRLTSIYHRLMFSMSIFEVMASTAIALNTLPMPRDSIYNFSGSMLGTTATCTAQGFSFFFGSNMTAAYNCALCIYYMCSIRFKMRDAIISKRVEPTLHTLCILFTLPLCILVWRGDFYNPTPYDAWCTGEPYPWFCRDNECTIRGKMNEFVNWIRYYLIAIFALETLIIIPSMVVIVWFVYRQEVLLNRLTDHMVRRGRTLGDDSRDRLAASRARHKFTKVMLTQAIAYLAAFFICQSNVIMSLLIRNRPTWLQAYHLITRPLQGLFNLIIFIMHKAYDARSLESNLTFRQAVWKVIKDKEETRVIISHISLIGIDNGSEDDGLLFDGVDDEDSEDDDSESEKGISHDRSSTIQSNDIERIPIDNANGVRTRGLDLTSSSNHQITIDGSSIHDHTFSARGSDLSTANRTRNFDSESFVDDKELSLAAASASATSNKNNSSRKSFFSSIGSFLSYNSVRNMSLVDAVSSEGVLTTYSENSANRRWD